MQPKALSFPPIMNDFGAANRGIHNMNAAAPKHVSPVRAALELLNERIENLDALLTTLEERLLDVTVSRAPGDMAGEASVQAKCEPAVASCPLALSLDAAGEKISTLAARVRSVELGLQL